MSTVFAVHYRLILALSIFAMAACNNGKDGAVGASGANGTAGAAGATGSNGAVGPSISTVSASYYNGASQSITNSSWTIINFDTKAFDASSVVTTGASWKVTAPSTGLYLFNVSMRFSSGCSWTAATTRQLRLLSNGTTVVADLDYKWDQTSHTNPVELRGSTALRLAASDFLSAQVFQDTGGTCAINTGLATSFSVIRIGD